MSIKQTVIRSAVVNLCLIVVIAAFAYRDMNRIVAKLRFVELADDLNASFLEMRLAEKNFFLYNDRAALQESMDNIAKLKESLDSMRGDIVKATGEDNLRQLLVRLDDYAAAVRGGLGGPDKPPDRENDIRAAGKQLREFSQAVTRLERSEVHRIIDNSRKGMFLSFWAFLLATVFFIPFVARRVVVDLRRIEAMAGSIAAGDFETIETPAGDDEIGSVIRAVNAMSAELKKREDTILQTKKLASLGTLTAGVAHEITNPLNNISMIAQTYEQVYEDLSQEERIEFMRKIDAESERIKNIVVHLLDFSKPKEAELNEARMTDIVQRTMTLLRNQLHVSGIEEHLALPDGLPAVQVDENQIVQVLVNLVTNAIQAMRPGGVLTVSARYNAEDAAVEVEVKDTGRGIAGKHLPHIFDPFFSTKGVDGTGLGLSISYGIVKQHRGAIRAESVPGKGSVFTVSLPAYFPAQGETR